MAPDPDDRAAPKHNSEYGREHDGYSHVGIPPGCPACAAERQNAPTASDDRASAALAAIRDEALGSIAYAGNHACPDAGSSCSAHNALRLLAAVEAAWALAANAQVVRAAITAALTGDSESEPPQTEADRRAADEALEALRERLAGDG